MAFYVFLCFYISQRFRECFRINVSKGVSQRIRVIQLACRGGVTASTVPSEYGDANGWVDELQTR